METNRSYGLFAGCASWTARPNRYITVSQADAARANRDSQLRSLLRLISFEVSSAGGSVENIKPIDVSLYDQAVIDEACCRINRQGLSARHVLRLNVLDCVGEQPLNHIIIGVPLQLVADVLTKLASE